MKFSLVLGTIGNPGELHKFLEHLDNQGDLSFELIVVDQSPDDRLASILSLYHDHFPITHLRSDTGLSKARNAGIPHASGDYIAFPDDDCWYPPELLQTLSKKFDRYPYIDGFTGRTVDENKRSIIRFSSKPGNLTKLNAWYRANSSSLFFRRKVISSNGEFDEELGPGSLKSWDSADDVDYVIRCVGNGFRLYYDPSIIVFHKDHRSDGYEQLLKRAYQYGAGIGRVWKKHNFPTWYIGYHFLRPLGGIISSALTGNLAKAKYHWLSLQGRYSGWRTKL